MEAEHVGKNSYSEREYAMFSMERRKGFGLFMLLACFTALGCSLFSGVENGIKVTPAPTEAGGGGGASPGQNPCEGLSGAIELQVLIGPSEAVGLTPYSVGHFPFSAAQDGETFVIEGGGSFDYYEEVLEADWGSYTVRFDGEAAISGECTADEPIGMLNITLEMTGEQSVVVVVEGVETIYPWSGAPTLTISFPIEDGVQQAGEGWVLILHLD